MSSDNMPSSGNVNRENQGPVEHGIVLPDSYGTTEAFLLPRDPAWMFMYWEITPATVENLKARHGHDIFTRSRSVIRLYNVSGVVNFDTANARYTDVPVVLDAKSWYLNAPESGASYICELGLVGPDGKFISIVRTNTVCLPSGRVSDVTDEHWMSVSEDFEKLLQMSGVQYIGRGSGETAKMLAQRWEMMKSVFSRSGSSWGLTSLPGGRQEAGARSFWLVADCELVLYGATEPDAKVTVAGRSVRLNPDGTFTLRFAFPDGKLDLPVHAESNDGQENRTITITADRRTSTDEKR